MYWQVDERRGGHVARYKRVHPDAIVPQRMTEGAAAFDLAAVEDIRIPDLKGPSLFSTGLVIAAPRHHMLFITHRSSTPRKWNVTIMNGIVDEDYCGDDDILSLNVMPLAWQFGQHEVIPAGVRIAQGIFVPVTHGIFEEAEEMGKSRGGWGSTG